MLPNGSVIMCISENRQAQPVDSTMIDTTRNAWRYVKSASIDRRLGAVPISPFYYLSPVKPSVR